MYALWNAVFIQSSYRLSECLFQQIYEGRTAGQVKILVTKSNFKKMYTL